MDKYTLQRRIRAELTAEGAPFEIGEITLQSRTVKIYKNAPVTLLDVWDASLRYGDRDYIVYEEERWSYKDAHRDVASVARWMQRQGIGSGDRVAISMRNYPEWILALWATLRIGATVVALNAWWTAAEMQNALRKCPVRLFVGDQRSLEQLSKIDPPLIELPPVGVRMPSQSAKAVSDADHIPWTALLGNADEAPPVEIDPEHVAAIFFTSGTTGSAKAVPLTHRTCITSLMGIEFSNTLNREFRRQTLGELPAPPLPATLITTPLFHVSANNTGMQPMTSVGGKLVLMYRWDAGNALRLIENERITRFTVVPLFARELVTHPSFTTTDTSSVQTAGIGATAIPAEYASMLHRAFANAAPSTGYGMTESCGPITGIGGTFYLENPASSGPFLPHIDYKCVDENGASVSPGVAGELYLKGGSFISHYLGEENSDDFTEDGWFRTGDIACIDRKGYLTIIDRVKEIIIRGGENISSAEVEAAILSYGNIRQCAAFSVKDERLGEEVGVAIVPDANTNLSEDGLREFLQTRIAAHKVPRYIWFSDDVLPTNATGKLLKSLIRNQFSIKNAV